VYLRVQAADPCVDVRQHVVFEQDVTLREGANVSGAQTMTQLVGHLHVSGNFTVNGVAALHGAAVFLGGATFLAPYTVQGQQVTDREEA
jgi:hypothetical protein